MKLVVAIRPTQTRTIEAEAEDYDTAKAHIHAQVPNGWQILALLGFPPAAGVGLATAAGAASGYVGDFITRVARC